MSARKRFRRSVTSNDSKFASTPRFATARKNVREKSATYSQTKKGPGTKCSGLRKIEMVGRQCAKFYQARDSGRAIACYKQVEPRKFGPQGICLKDVETKKPGE